MLEYGIVGNCHTSALISKEGDVDWMCYPTFDSPSVFASLLDEEQGGSFSVDTKNDYETDQYYLDRNAILITDFIRDNKAFRVFDFFPRYKSIIPENGEEKQKNFFIRIIEPLRGTPELTASFNPQLDYARGETRIEKDGCICKATKDDALWLKTNTEPDTFKLDDRTFFAIGDETVKDITLKKALGLKRHTEKYWNNWVNSLVLPKQNRDTIIRSAITLKLLTYDKTGAIIAAPTTSIPEEIGTERCWDYRYCWLRDSSYAVDALKKIGRGYESKQLIDFVMRTVDNQEDIQPLYGIEGETALDEETLPHLKGFKNSKPVRIGNDAYKQKQNDIYGEIIDVIYLYFAFYNVEDDMPEKYWNLLENLVEKIRENWKDKDLSIWEFREKKAHYTFSKLMCFVGVDRAIKVAEYFGRDKLVDTWSSLRIDIKDDILENGYDEEREAFTIHYDSPKLDASLLRMTYHEFLDQDDERLQNTVRQIFENLTYEDLVKRYKIEDDFGYSSSAFTICSFWMIHSLYYVGNHEEAQKMYDKLLSKSNHLGLFSEDIGLENKDLLGNFPQAYTHIALINTSILLSEWSTKRKKIDWNLKLKKRVY